MSEDKTSISKGTVFASIGALFTIVSLSIFDDKGPWPIITAAIGLSLALYGFWLNQKDKKT